MSSQLLIERPKENKDNRIIRVVISANGAKYEEQGGKLFDWSHEGRVIDIEVGEEEYQLIKSHIKNMWSESIEDWSMVNNILQNGLANAGIPEGYQVCAFLKFVREEM